jgi:hypothetical protein
LFASTAAGVRAFSVVNGSELVTDDPDKLLTTGVEYIVVELFSYLLMDASDVLFQHLLGHVVVSNQ